MISNGGAKRTQQEQADRDIVQQSLEEPEADDEEDGYDLSALDGHAATGLGAVVQWDPAEQGDNMLGLLITEEVWRRNAYYFAGDAGGSATARKRRSDDAVAPSSSNSDAAAATKRRVTTQWLGPCASA